MPAQNVSSPTKCMSCFSTAAPLGEVIESKIDSASATVGTGWRMGCELGAMHRFAYPELPDEVQLLWYKALA